MTIMSDKNLLIIPTRNRSAKLKRILEWYALNPARLRIVILDASDDPIHKASNERTAAAYTGFATRVATQDTDNIPARLLGFLPTVDDQIVALGNDEDGYLPEFLDSAFEFLRGHPDYSLATGKYITTSRPLLGVRRISYWTDTFVGMDVDEPDAALRVLNFQRLNSGGIPPLYWSVRRKSALIESCRLSQRLQFSSAHELIDQICSCALGKISITDRPMLLRDESKLKNISIANRDVGKLYIGTEDLDRLNELALERWGAEVGLAARAVTSWYRPKVSGDSYLTRLGRKAYCRFSPPPGIPPNRMLSCLEWGVAKSCTAGVLLSQILAYFYYWKLMSLYGRGRDFLKMTRTMAVTKTS